MLDLRLAHEFEAEPLRDYLLFCPENGGWHVGQWWTLDDAARWVLAFDPLVELHPSYLMELPDVAAAPTGVLRVSPIWPGQVGRA